MKLTISARIVLGFAFALGMLLIVALASVRNTARLQEDVAWVQHTLAVLQEKERLARHMFEAQSIARGHALAADPAVRERFDVASNELRRTLGSLRQLTADNSIQQQRLDRLEPLLIERLTSSQRLIEASNGGAVRADGSVVAIVDHGRTLNETINDLVRQIEAEERELLQVRQSASDEARRGVRAFLR